ncbi:YggU family protein [Spongiibacter sp. KMU-158]|uniref:UPF0235 protein IB286_00140 n=1 Tax=Spongiibacter pelagi TaxID=2760804 RepID=A0A927BYJ1_9GAMM|nr:DUF167 family protein [Spongiibacter pelagi]MBD2857394.1 YggU family protein [Spongiibacter pelagi]
MSPYYRWQGEELQLFVHCQPGASKEEFAGQHGDRLKIRLRAAATEGQANKALISFLAKQFKVGKAEIELSSGAQSRQKTLKIKQPNRLPEELEITAP